MYLIVSNNGPWDPDQFGTINASTAIRDFDDLIVYHEQDDNALQNFNIISDPSNEELNELFEEYDINYLCAGRPVKVAIKNEIAEADMPTIYIVVASHDHPYLHPTINS